MVTYDIGIEFSVNTKIERLEYEIGAVKCILEQKAKTTVRYSDGSMYCYAILLQSICVEDAIECIELLCAAKSIIDSVISVDIDHFVSNIYNAESKRLGRQCYIEHMANAIQISDIGIGWYKAIEITEKSFDNICDKISVLKYYNAKIIYDIHPMDLDPNDSISLNLTLLNRLRIAYSIIDLHSIIEELGLEIRASKQEPSVIDNAWNSKILNDLERRLSSSGVNPNKLIPWISRKGHIRPFKSKVIDSSLLCSWSDDDQILDFEISIKDAILEIDYQRDVLASHGVGERINKLSIIDLENAFHLLRIILMDRFCITIDEIQQGVGWMTAFYDIGYS